MKVTMRMSKQLMRRIRVLIVVSVCSLMVFLPAFSQPLKIQAYDNQTYVNPHNCNIKDFANAVWDWASSQSSNPLTRITKICERIRYLIDTADGRPPVAHSEWIWIIFPIWGYWYHWPAVPTPHPSGDSWGQRWVADLNQLWVGRWRSIYGGWGDAKFYGQTYETGINCWVNFALLMSVLQSLHNQGKFSIYDIKGCRGENMGWDHYWVKGWFWNARTKVWFFASFDNAQYVNGKWNFADFYYSDPPVNTEFVYYYFKEAESIVTDLDTPW